MSNKYVKLGALMKNKQGGFYIALDKEINLNVNGRKFTGKYISCDKPQAKFERMLAKGTITEEEYSEKVEKIPEYVRQELTVVFDD